LTTLDGPLLTGDQVRNERLGIGRVEFDKGATVIVRFGSGLEECEKSTLTQIWTSAQAILQSQWQAPLKVITRVQAEAIQSVNDMWGVFSRSRIKLLPHQLWVCRQVLERWPARWLVADDVGLGKTIEAGLILWPLLARGTVKRLLVLCPASLVPQWQWRLGEMFDIRLTRYVTQADAPRAEFWNTNHQVVASLQTLRARGERQKRLIESDPWDLLIVDEAHHLNFEEHSAPSLGYELVDQLTKRVPSVLFFTGTPHRGKDFGFWSLLQLLRPDLFNGRRPAAEQLPLLRQVMIRNNKQNVTDLKGDKLFQPSTVTSETYAYSQVEARFYAMLTEFILTGKAYASSLSATNSRTVILVLIAMQKLASSSVAAIRRALKGRLMRLNEARARLARHPAASVSAETSIYENLEESGEFDSLSREDEKAAADWITVQLMMDEEPRLRELISVADEVTEETKISKIISTVEERFPGRSVLLFTEYKATQSLVMSALHKQFGDGCATFINGDERAEDVRTRDGKVVSLNEKREDAADKFNTGQVRFLVSTEAGGEGIDLQWNCHSLIHVDLPWNPMRLHQRVGRLNRYGQDNEVEVINLRNPDTVEARIWEKLNTKLQSITLALKEVMDEPEDLLQLVLGMASPSLFRELFWEANSVPDSSLAGWFDQKTARFGGKDALETARDLVGYAARFDFQEVSARIPRVDLPALVPFFKAMVLLNGRQVRDEAGGLSFRSPEAWRKDPGVRDRYDGLLFDRELPSGYDSQRIVGVGHRAMDQAIAQAKSHSASVTTLPARLLQRPLLVFIVEDGVTTIGGMIRSVVAGVLWDLSKHSDHRLLSDWQVILELNRLLGAPGFQRPRPSPPASNISEVTMVMSEAEDLLKARLVELDLPFKVPVVVLHAVLWPRDAGAGTARPLDGEDDG
jgi:ERCC4-related helicase